MRTSTLTRAAATAGALALSFALVPAAVSQGVEKPPPAAGHEDGDAQREAPEEAPEKAPAPEREADAGEDAPADVQQVEIAESKDDDVAERKADGDAQAKDSSRVTVTADLLPTPQINGVVWDQIIVGDVVYFGGSFTSARPFGAKPGEKESPRGNIGAYNLKTGELLPWAPKFNGAIRTFEKSVDGKYLYIGGEFTSVDGAKRYRLATIDIASGKLASHFSPTFDYNVYAIEAIGNVVYVGGKFSSVNGEARTNIAAFRNSDAYLFNWQPEIVGGHVRALAVNAGTMELVIAGNFSRINGYYTPGWGAVHATKGESVPWAANRIIQNHGRKAAIYSLTKNDEGVFATGYAFSSRFKFEGVAKALWDGGGLNWTMGCRGDHYDAVPNGPVVYAAGHAHDCEPIDGIIEEKPRNYQHALALTTKWPKNTYNKGGYFSRYRAPKLYGWNPKFTNGDYTGQLQATWTVETSGDYVVYGGEFPTVAGVKQQGLARFAKGNIAPKKSGPRGTLAIAKPTKKGNTYTFSTTALYDDDNPELTYELVRNGEVVASKNVTSFRWVMPKVTLVDKDATNARVKYMLVVRDADGNAVKSSSIYVGSGAVDDQPPAGEYDEEVLADKPESFWRLEEKDGAYASEVGKSKLTAGDGIERGVDGKHGAALATDGSAEKATAEKDKHFMAGHYSSELWFKTTTDDGGALINFGDSNDGTSEGRGRFTYMLPDGRIRAGVYNNGFKTVTSQDAFNDGKWHHVVATFGDDGISLYVDGDIQAANAEPEQPLRMWGYWRVGGDSLKSWPGGVKATAFDGVIDEVAVYNKALSAADVSRHFRAN